MEKFVRIIKRTVFFLSLCFLSTGTVISGNDPLVDWVKSEWESARVAPSRYENEDLHHGEAETTQLKFKIKDSGGARAFRYYPISDGRTKFVSSRRHLSDILRRRPGSDETHLYSVACNQNVYVASFSTATGDKDSPPLYDYYHVRASGVLSPTVKKKWHGNITPERYQLSWNLLDIPVGVASLLGSTPSTGNNTTEVTDTFGLSFSGKVSLPNDGGEIGGEMSWERAKKYQVKDMDVWKHVEDSMPRWDMVFNDRKASIAMSGADYDVEWVWAVDRQKAIDTKLYKKVDGAEEYTFDISSKVEVLWGKAGRAPASKRTQHFKFSNFTLPVPTHVFYGASVPAIH